MHKKIVMLFIAILVVSLMPIIGKADDESLPDGNGNLAEYVGAETCARCHANTHQTFIETWHAKILRPAEDSIILGDFTSQDPDLTFTREEVIWVVGGQFKQRYLTQLEGGLYVLPAEWNVVSGEWVAYEADNWRTRPYSQYCAGCHTTGYDPVTQTWAEPGISCEACHGPGKDHVASTGDQARIVNPAKLDFQNQIEVCAQCHSRGMDPSRLFPFPIGYYPGGPATLSETFVQSTNPDDFWPDGTAKRHHMQYQDWRLGEHQNSVGCIFCHNSHSTGETDHQTRMVGNDRCVVCHEGNLDLAEHIPYMQQAVDKVQCTDCHMPQISKFVQTDFQILSHTFRPPNPGHSIAYGGQEQMPNSCNICHEDQTPEWAAAMLGQGIPPTNATRVSPSTPLPVPTIIPISETNAERPVFINPPESQPQSSNFLLWGVSITALVAALSGYLAYRRIKSS